MFLKIYRWLALLIFLLMPSLLFAPATAKADGGAPNLAYVSGTGKGVSVIDVMQQKTTNTFSASGNPDMIALSLDGRFLYVAQPQSGHVAIITAKTGDTFCTANVPGQPTLLVIDSNNGNNFIFAAGEKSSDVTVIDPANCTIVRTLHTKGPIYGLAVAAVGAAVAANGTSGDQLWVAGPDSILIFDDSNGHKIGEVPFPDGPGYLSIPSGATVYATTRQGNIASIDLNNHSITSLVSGGTYGPMDYNAGTGEIYVPDVKNNQLVILAPVNSGFVPPKEPGRVIKLGVRPVSIAITSDGQLGFLALEGGNVAMLDIPNHERVITTINVGGNPRFIITGLYPPALGTTPQQASTLTLLFNIAGYAIVAILLIVPIILFRRYAKVGKTNEVPKK